MIMFDQKVAEALGFYVYALFGPRPQHSDNNWPFYIGKGCGNRVFSHSRGDPIQDVEGAPLSLKQDVIKAIKADPGNFNVSHKIIRFGLSEDEAFKVEAALIDMVNHVRPDTLLNEISGQGVALGFYDAADLATSLNASELVSELPLLIIKIERQWSNLLAAKKSASLILSSEIYEVMKGDWKLSVARADRAVCVLAVARGLVRAAFVPSPWVDAPNSPGRKMMERTTAENSLHSSLVGTSVAHLFKRGAANPIRYFNC